MSVTLPSEITVLPDSVINKIASLNMEGKILNMEPGKPDRPGLKIDFTSGQTIRMVRHRGAYTSVRDESNPTFVPDVEIASWVTDNGAWTTRAFKPGHSDDVIGWADPDEVNAFLNWAAGWDGTLPLTKAQEASLKVEKTCIQLEEFMGDIGIERGGRDGLWRYIEEYVDARLDQETS